MPHPEAAYVVTTTHSVEGVGDVVFVSDRNDTGEYSTMIRGEWAPSPALRYCIETLQPTDTFVDVGANLGEFALPIGKLGVNTLAVEALVANIGLLTEGVRRNRTHCVRVVHGAAGNIAGSVFVTGHSAWGHVVPGDPTSEQARVEAYRLDDLLPKYGFEEPRIVKIDVEGSEQRVLGGMPRTLASSTIELVVEANAWICKNAGYTYHDLLEQLERAGFGLYLIHERVLVPRTSSDLQEACVADYLATRRVLKGVVGSFVVRPLSLDESASILHSQTQYGIAHRWHLDRFLDEAPPRVRDHPAIRSLGRRRPSATGDRSGQLRIAWVIHQYGAEVGGGSETLCQTIAELLSDDVESTVLTTTARDYDPWASFYPAGEEALNGVRVLRFPADQAPPDELRAFYDDAHAHPEDPDRGRLWLEALGPRAPGLIEHLRGHATDYDVLCALPYVFATTLAAMEAFPGPKLLIPCAHNEPAFGLDVYRQVFELADAFAFNTDEEATLVDRRFGTMRKSARTIGIPVHETPEADPETFRSHFGVEGRYLLCVGRIDGSKGTDLLLDIHRRSLDHTPQHTLVLMGQPIMDVPELGSLVVTGHVDEEMKASAIAGASAVVLPSPYESLSIVALEAWAQGTPVLVNGASPVLLGQVRRSGGGLWYRDAHDYRTMVSLLLELPELGSGLGHVGRAWAHQTYAPQTVKASWLSVLDGLPVGSAPPSS